MMAVATLILTPLDPHEGATSARKDSSFVAQVDATAASLAD